MAAGDYICNVCGGYNGSHWPGCSCAALSTSFYIHVDESSFEPLLQVGWLCPRCKKVNGPHVNQCKCKAPEQNAAEVTIPSGVTTTNVSPEDTDDAT